jgi:asparagine synthase (glutamine-hydrolysing)
LATVDVTALRAATTSIRHRGPDDEGYLLVSFDGATHAIGGGEDTDPRLDLPAIGSFSNGDWSIGLAHRRLSILDLSPAGHQPMHCLGEDRIWVTFNGEIYNYLELREELAAVGVRFRTGSDTEVLLAAYREWGDAMLPRLVGMFAFVIVDLTRHRVLMARDQFGIKPLYYAQTSQGLYFASELKALLKFPGVGREADAHELYRYLRFGWTDGTPATFFRNIRQLPAAHAWTFPISEPGTGEPVRFWNPAVRQRDDLSFDKAGDELQRLFRKSMQLHMRSDVPVGACLSGGLDSSLIVRCMRDELGAKGDLHTFSFITDDPVRSEGPFVDMMSRNVHSHSHLTSAEPSDLIEDFDDLVRSQDQPFGSTSIYAQYRVFRLAGEAGMKVMLDGQGSDELFGGYYTAISARMTSLLAAGRVMGAMHLWRDCDVWEGSRGRVLLSSLGRLLPAPLASGAMSLVGESLMPAWMSGQFFRVRGVEPEPRPQGRGRNALREELSLFTESLSLPQLLRYEDRNSMHFSIESRVPFCTPELAEFAASLPESYLVSDEGDTKAVLRAASNGMVPDEIIKRPKVGFATPEREWLGRLRPWVQQQLESEQARQAPFLDRRNLEALVTGQLSAGDGVFRSSLWRVMNVIRWAELMDVQFS